MSSVLHPVGPEPQETYWARRVAVLLALVALIGLVVALVVNGSSTGSAVSANPAPPGVAATTDSPSPSPADSSESPSSPASSSAPKKSSSAASKAPSSTKPSTKPRAKPSAKPSAAAPADCRPQQLRPTLTGKQRLKPAQRTTFRLSLINGSASTCAVSVNAENFELKIYSGTDRIWSTGDCSTAVKEITRKVGAEDAVEWTMTWDGKRSRSGCKHRPEVPRPGTYFATAQLEGAKPVQLRLILGG